MLDERDRKTADLYGITERVEKLQKELLQIEGVNDVDFDLSGFLSDIPYVIFLPEYDIDVRLDDYFERRRKLLTEAVRVAAKGLSLTAPEGTVTIDGGNQHLYKQVRIGKINEQGLIDEVWATPSAVKPDPYLSTYPWARGL